MDTPWQIELLGRLRATCGERVVTRFRAQKTGALLAYLAYHLHRPHPREVLIDLLWPDANPRSGRNNLSRELNSLRHQLEPPGVPAGAVILADRYSVELNPAVCVTDVAAFEAAIQAAARAESTAGPVQGLAEVVHRYSGELLPGCFEDWVLQERQHLAEEYLGALRRLVTALEQAGDLEGALEYARRAARADSLNEETHSNLMRLYAAVGQPAAALRQYQELEHLLREELDELPSAATRALVEELGYDASKAVVERRAPRAGVPAEGHGLASLPTGEMATSLPPSSPRPRLPLQFTRFFGREHEITRLTERLRCSETRLVTLTGPGGSGKTRLALEVAARLTESFADAVWFVPLVDLTDARLIVEKIHDTMDLPRSPAVEPLEQVVAALARSPALILLDNFEHLVTEGALTVRALLERVPTLTCLVTSRQRLDLTGEREFLVVPLATPQAPEGSVTAEFVQALSQNDSVRLFADRAQAVRPDFQVTRTNAADVAALCARLEGIPLALELAAARALVLTPAQMLVHLEQRFDFLVSRRRDASARHRTLRAAIDWSYHLMVPELQRFFARLWVFRGGWTLEAAEAVCDEPLALDYMEQLRECSLILTETSDARCQTLVEAVARAVRRAPGASEPGEAIRFGMLDTLREYARDQLTASELAVAERRHAEHYLALAEQAESELLGAQQVSWLDRLEREHDNLRVALAWSQAEPDSGETGLRLAGALWKFWATRGYLGEGSGWFASMLARSDSVGKTGFGSGAESSGGRAPGRARRSGRTQARAKALQGAGTLAWHQGDYTAARSLLQESLEISLQIGNKQLSAWALVLLGNVARGEGDLTAARALLTKGRAISLEAEERSAVAWSLNGLGLVAMAEGDYTAARSLCEDSLVILRELGHPEGVVWSLLNLGDVARCQGDYDRAAALYQESLWVCQESGVTRSISYLLEGLAAVASVRGQLERAAKLFGAAKALRDGIGASVPPVDRAGYERDLATVRDGLAEAAFAAAWAEGRGMTLERVITYALEVTEPATGRPGIVSSETPWPPVQAARRSGTPADPTSAGSPGPGSGDRPPSCSR